MLSHILFNNNKMLIFINKKSCIFYVILSNFSAHFKMKITCIPPKSLSRTNNLERQITLFHQIFSYTVTPFHTPGLHILQSYMFSILMKLETGI